MKPPLKGFHSPFLEKNYSTRSPMTSILLDLVLNSQTSSYLNLRLHYFILFYWHSCLFILTPLAVFFNCKVWNPRFMTVTYIVTTPAQTSFLDPRLHIPSLLVTSTAIRVYRTGISGWKLHSTNSSDKSSLKPFSQIFTLNPSANFVGPIFKDSEFNHFSPFLSLKMIILKILLTHIFTVPLISISAKIKYLWHLSIYDIPVKIPLQIYPNY